MNTIRTFDQWWTEIENFAMRGERLSDMLSKSALAQVAYDEGVAAARATQPQAPQGAVPDTAPMYKALIESKLALLACNSGASIRALSLIDAVLCAAPETPEGKK